MNTNKVFFAWNNMDEELFTFSTAKDAEKKAKEIRGEYINIDGQYADVDGEIWYGELLGVTTEKEIPIKDLSEEQKKECESMGADSWTEYPFTLERFNDND